jgi:hypothetical protein
MLPPKFAVREIPSSQVTPENSLVVGRAFAQVTSAAHEIIVYSRSLACEKPN